VPIEAGMLVQEYTSFGGFTWAMWVICEILPETPSTCLVVDRLKTRLVALQVGGKDESGELRPWECVYKMENSCELQLGIGKPRFRDDNAVVAHPYNELIVNLSKCTLVVSKSSVPTLEAAMCATYSNVVQQLAADPRYASWMHEVWLSHHEQFPS
jgi:hypothetical protein